MSSIVLHLNIVLMGLELMAGFFGRVDFLFLHRRLRCLVFIVT